MGWLEELFVGSSIAHSVLLIGIVIAAGTWLGRLKIAKISLGITMVLFVGIIAGHFGMTIPPDVLHFLKEFGLILFVYAVGLQVGPGFFASLRKGGLQLNLVAVGVVLLGVGVTIALFYLSDLEMATMVGILSGAVTNTPGLGAAGQTYADMHGATHPDIALGYAVAYPLGVLGIIATIIILRAVFRVSIKKEEEELKREDAEHDHLAHAASFVVTNPSIFGHTIEQVMQEFPHGAVVVSRHLSCETHKIVVAEGSTLLQENDRLFVIAPPEEIDKLTILFGKQVEMDRKQWIPTDSNLQSFQFTVSNKALTGKRLGDLQLRQVYGVNVTRINRAGLDMVASPRVRLQVGDIVTVVGSDTSLNKVREIVGDSSRHLNEPNLIGIFLGIAIGMLFGSIPFVFPGIPQPVKLGLAGGPLVVAMLMSKYGTKFRIVTYTTQSANLMLREIGITLFLACVGIGAGEGFVDAIVHQGGYVWIGYGVLITIIPIFIMGIVARKCFKVNYLTIAGVLAGSMTDPPALAYANTLTEEDAPAVGYATVYPLTMFLRVLTAQLLVILFT